MVTYIYFVKCPDCEDEYFDFFDEAKEFALGCLSKKPIITQTEVCRNDFGECTDHSDLGTIWSWEDECRDTEGGYTEAEPTKSIFTKDDLKRMAGGSDPEFDSIDNSVDFEVEEPVTSEISAIDDVPDNFRKPIPEGMTIEQLVEEMEENEDAVECVCCNELYPKEECKHDEKHGWLCPDCQDEVVECTWCEELYDKSECRYEVDLGWLCDRCQSAIMSRGESLTFREGNYWDFLDEKLDFDFSNCVDSSDMEIWGVEPIDESTYKAVLMKRYENVSKRGYDESQKVYDEMYDIDGLFTFGFGKDTNPWLEAWNVHLLNRLGQCEIIFDDERYDQACEKTINRHSSKLEEPEEKSMLEELEDKESYNSRLVVCPECGFETLDLETGICINCGFNHFD